MLNVRYYCLQHGGNVGDVIAVTVFTGDHGSVKYGEWVVGPKAVFQRWLYPVTMSME